MDTSSFDTRRRHVLVAVCGMTPQIVTETLYGIHQQGQPFPDEIQLITTADGAAKAVSALLTEGILARFCADYGLPEPLFGDEQIHILRDAAGNVMRDIRKRSENESMADFIVEHIRRLTVDPQTILHVSLAGGRKTMSYYIGYALSLLGRPQDSLSHVLVEDEYESCPDFWYPTPYPHAIKNRNGASVDARLAEVHLAPIPFVRLREWLPEPVLLEQRSFNEVVANMQLAQQQRHVVIDVTSGCLIINGMPLSLGAADFAFYWCLAQQVIQRRTGIPSLVEGDRDPELAREYLACYRRVKKLGLDEDDRTTEGLSYTDPATGARRHGLHKAFIEQRKTAINKTLKERFGALGPERFGIPRPRAETAKWHTLAVPVNELEIRES